MFAPLGCTQKSCIKFQYFASFTLRSIPKGNLVFIAIVRAENVCRVLLASKTFAISTERAVAQLTVAEITSLNEVHATVGLSSVGFHTLVEYATN